MLTYDCNHPKCLAEDVICCHERMHDGWWECECSMGQEWLHQKSREMTCPRCGARADEMPDARVAELYDARLIDRDEAATYRHPWEAPFQGWR